VKSHTSVLGLFLRSHQDTAEAESIPWSDHSAAVSDTPSPCHKTVPASQHLLKQLRRKYTEIYSINKSK